jgi:hypothetical protein
MEKQENVSARNMYARLGFWSALVCAIGAVAYGVISIIVAATDVSALTFDTYAKFIANYSPLPTFAILTPPFLVALIFPILALSIYATASDERRPLALLALIFAGVYTAVLGMGYWMQLTFVPQSIAEGNTVGLDLWLLWHPRSFFWSIESFGYFAMGISSMFLAFSYKANALPRRIRWGLILMAPLGLAFMFNEALGIWPLASVTPLLLLFSWVILFAFVAFSLAHSFTKLRKTQLNP